MPPCSPFLHEILRAVPRRYRLPAMAATSQIPEARPATALALTIEQARRAMIHGAAPDPVLKRHFISALAQMIHDAMRTESGDPVFQALVLRNRGMTGHEYETLVDQQGPRSGSVEAANLGSESQQRGAAVEALATQALEALAERLNHVEAGQAEYRVVTSMRVPAAIAASIERAKSEWDAVLLRQVKNSDAPSAWDVCLFVEAKASLLAATTDLPRLLRGLHMLARAEDNAVYSFQTQQGAVRLRGASLSALTTDASGLTRSVLYCCDAATEATPRLLNAASRMQLLSAQASLDFGGALLDKRQPYPEDLEAVWHQLFESPRWRAVLHQYPMLHQVRELMIHPEDLVATVAGTAL